MTATLNPYLSFPDSAREAMEFYRSVLGGELTISTFGDLEGEEQAGVVGTDLVMHAQLTTPAGFTLMASDTPPGADFTPGAQISVSVSGDDEAELRGYWEKLAEDGRVHIPLGQQPWGDVFGLVVDRFGIQWMINITG